MTNENTDSSNCCDSSWRRTAPDGAGWYAVIGERVKVGPETVLARMWCWRDRQKWCTNQIFPGAAIGLEPQDLKYDGSKTQVKIDGNRIRGMSLLIAQRGLVKRR